MQKILYGIGALFALLLLLGMLLPRESVFEISREVRAPAATVFALIDAPRQSYLWSRIRETDPDAEVRFSGPFRGAGATMAWDGVIGGSGVEQNLGSRPYRSITKVLNPGEPGESMLRYEIAATAGGSEVTLRFEHDHALNLVGRYMGPLLTPVLRRDHAAGLDALAELAESLPDADFSGLAIEHVEAIPARVAWLPTSSAATADAVSEALGDAYFRISSVLRRNGIEPSGPPMSVLREFSGAHRVFDAAIPIGETGDIALRDAGGVRLGTGPGGPAVRAVHRGAYRGLRNTHRQVRAYIAAYGLETDGDPWETYVGDPSSVAGRDLATWVSYPLRVER